VEAGNSPASRKGYMKNNCENGRSIAPEYEYHAKKVGEALGEQGLSFEESVVGFYRERQRAFTDITADREVAADRTVADWLTTGYTPDTSVLINGTAFSAAKAVLATRNALPEADTQSIEYWWGQIGTAIVGAEQTRLQTSLNPHGEEITNTIVERGVAHDGLTKRNRNTKDHVIIRFGDYLEALDPKPSSGDLMLDEELLLA
jgi:hypothetical protein